MSDFEQLYLMVIGVGALIGVALGIAAVLTS